MNIDHALIVDFNELRRVTLTDLLSTTDKLHREFQKITGYIWNNQRQYIRSITGHLYSFRVSPYPANTTIHVWDDTGCTEIVGSRFIRGKDDRVPADTIELIRRGIDKYERGFLVCSDCGREIPVQSASVFAAHYCPDCWTGITGQYKDKGGWYKYQSSPGFYE